MLYLSQFKLQVNIIRIYQQLDYFAEYQQRLAALIGAGNAKKLVNDALVLITLGGNDFVNNYYLIPFSARSRQYPLPNYIDFVISEYKKVLKVFHLLSSTTNFTFMYYSSIKLHQI